MVAMSLGGKKQCKIGRSSSNSADISSSSSSVVKKRMVQRRMSKSGQ